MQIISNYSNDEKGVFLHHGEKVETPHRGVSMFTIPTRSQETPHRGVSTLCVTWLSSTRPYRGSTWTL